MTGSAFVTIVSNFYREHGRDLPWRNRPARTSTREWTYHIVVSEIMLQQTQVSRVMQKFGPFIKRFPSFAALAAAPTVDVLKEWQGLGYNRRGLNLHRLAQTVVEGYGGDLPKTYDELTELPGIGPNTAGSILAFAFNIPLPFIETNIRSVYIHHFFPDIEKADGRKACKKISDDDIMPHIEETLTLAMKKGAFKADPRQWYYALMDYGSSLKKNLPNPSRRSSHHVKQSKFEGSNRQVRAKILRMILEKPRTIDEIEKECSSESFDRAHVAEQMTNLEKEGFLIRKKNKYEIMSS